MPDITYEALMAAKQASKDTTPEFDIMKMADVALRILEQVNSLKGTGGGERVITSRPSGEGSEEVSQNPMMNVEQILGTLNTVKSLKGDIKLSELESLIKEHKDQIQTMMEAAA